MTNPVVNAIAFAAAAVLLIAICGLFWAGLGAILALLVNTFLPEAGLDLWRGMVGVLLLTFVGSFFRSSR